MNPMKIPLVSIFVLIAIPGGLGWAIASAKYKGDKE
jgi:hypothetical protein